MIAENTNRKQYPKDNSINPTEMRMGNWVQTAGGKKPVRWTLEKFYEYYVNPERICYYEPIPLTPEILEKNCGFGYIKVDGVSRLSDDFDDFEELQKQFTHNWTLNVKASEHSDSFRFEIVKWGEQEYFTFAHQWLRVRIKYLHQLQNLYFALTAQELTINL